MNEIGECVENLVVGFPLTELFSNDVEVSEPRQARAGNDHRFGATADEGLYVFVEDPKHYLSLVLDKAIVLEGDILERFGDNTLRVELLLIGLWHDTAMQVIESLI